MVKSILIRLHKLGEFACFSTVTFVAGSVIDWVYRDRIFLGVKKKCLNFVCD